MLTKGIIQSIDLLSNTCVVRLPLFETAGTNTAFTAEAVFSNQPGIYNGYSVNDIVVVGFGSGGYGDAIVIGKLYLGVSNEKSVVGGSVHCSDFIASNSVSLPANTTLNFSTDSSKITNAEVVSINSYSSLKDLAEAVASNTNSINSLASQKTTYSSSEEIVGYWINDKTIYQRTLTVTESETTNKLTYTFNTNINTGWIDLTNSFIYNKDTGNTKSLPDYEINISTTSAVITSNTTLATNEIAYITIKYIK